jgi:hypothetical protein
MALFRGDGGAGTGDITTVPLSIGNGGTGATNTTDARDNLGLGTIAIQDASGVAITGGSVTGITDLAIADGGTGASTANTALNNLLPSQTSNSGKYLKTDGTDTSWDDLDISTADITGTLPIANGGTGSTDESTARTNLGLEIGVDVQAYDADTAKYDDVTANFTGTLQNGGSNVVVDTDIGSTVQAYDADTAKYDDTTANFTGTLQNGGSNVLVDTDIGSAVQAYDADTAKYDDTTANFTGTLQNGGSNVVVDTDIGSTVQAYDADTAKYDDTTANFTGTLQNGGSNVVVDTDIGSTVLAYDSNLQGFVTAFTLPTTDGTANQLLQTDGAGTLSFTSAATGTVTSVAATVPTGFVVTGSPITTSGTLAFTFDTGYALPTTASQSNWDTAFGWGDHAAAGYLDSADIGVTVQGYDADTAKYDDVTANFTGTLQNGGNTVLTTASTIEGGTYA